MSANDSSLPGPCLDEFQLRQILQSTPKEPVTGPMLGHLDRCPLCAERLERLATGGQQNVPTSWENRREESSTLRGLMQRLHDSPPTLSPEEPDPAPKPEDVLLPPESPGSIGSFAGYDVLEKIAAGGMGIVFKAFDPRLNRVVALKVLAPVLAASEVSRARFLREARAAAAVVHDFVVGIHAVGEERGLPYLAMQFIAGKSLETRLAHGPMTLTEILRVGWQTAEGLAAAHAQGLIHRDVKPANILLENGIERVKLTDFGLARAVDDPGLTRAGVVAGTPEFMSPEQASGQRLDVRSDLFSLGAVLHLMATGQSPFRADSTLVTLKRVCDHQPPTVNRVNLQLPEWLGGVITGLLAKRPEDRFASAAEVAGVLRNHLQGLQLPTDSSPGHAPPNGPKRPLRWQGPALVSALVIGSLGWFLQTRRPTGSAVSPAPTGRQAQFVRCEPSGARTPFGDLSAAVQAATSGDAIELAFDGPLATGPIIIRDKVLTLRAQRERRPQLVNGATNGTMLSTDSALTLEGIELRTFDANADQRALVRDLTVPGSPTARKIGDALYARAESSQNAIRPALVDVRNADLTANHCRFVNTLGDAIPFDSVALLQPGRSVIQDCEFYNLGGIALRLRLNPGTVPADPELPRVTVTNCLLYASQPVSLFTPAQHPLGVYLQHCSIFGIRLWNYRVPPAGTLEATDNLIAVRHFFSYTDAEPAPGTILKVERRNIFSSLFPGDPRSNVPRILGEGSGAVAVDFAGRINAVPASQRLEPADFRLVEADAPAAPGIPWEELRLRGCATDRLGPGGIRGP